MRVMRKQNRNEELEIEYGSDSAKTVKFIALGLASIVVVGGVLGGIVFLLNEPAQVGRHDDRYVLTDGRYLGDDQRKRRQFEPRRHKAGAARLPQW
jgi:hypothetical protein